MGQPPHILHRQDEVLGGLEQPDGLVVQDVEKAPPVHLQNLVPDLPRPQHNTTQSPGPFAGHGLVPGVSEPWSCPSPAGQPVQEEITEAQRGCAGA